MTLKGLEYCENFERVLTEFNLLDLVKEQLTEKGLEFYNKKGNG